MDPATLINGIGGFLKVLGKFGRGDIPPCFTRVQRGDHGYPWNKLLTIHTTMDGKQEIRLLSSDEIMERVRNGSVRLIEEQEED